MVTMYQRVRKKDEEADMESPTCQFNESGFYHKVCEVGKSGEVVKSRNSSQHNWVRATLCHLLAIYHFGKVLESL